MDRERFGSVWEGLSKMWIYVAALCSPGQVSLVAMGGTNGRTDRLNMWRLHYYLSVSMDTDTFCSAISDNNNNNKNKKSYNNSNSTLLFVQFY